MMTLKRKKKSYVDNVFIRILTSVFGAIQMFIRNIQSLSWINADQML